MASFEELKSKYQSVITVIQQQQVSLKNLNMQDGKLFMKGVAPSLDAANAVWNEIKRINPKADDIMADFPVDTSMQQSQASSNVRMYKVKPGDTLSKISKEVYGSTNNYMKIFEANRDQLSDPNKIQVGQELKIPAA
jgi:nucleoid-associated protein YgaU